MTKITKILFKKMVEGSLGTQRDISLRLKVSDSGMSQYLNKHPDMKKLLDEQRLNNVDKAEHEIFKQLTFNDDKPAVNAKIRQTASQFILSRLGRDKGWVEKQEIESNVKVDMNMDKIREAIKSGKGLPYQ